MKKKFPVIGAYLLGLLMVFVGITLTCSSCKEKPAFFGGDDSECESDSILVAQYITIYGSTICSIIRTKS